MQLRAVKFLPAEVRVRIGEDDAAEFVDRRAQSAPDGEIGGAEDATHSSPLPSVNGK